jgi:spermidine synthase
MARSSAAGWSIEVSEERGVRYLHFGSHYVQGAMRIARPWALELDYTRDLMLPLLLRGPQWPASVLQVGLGSASVTKFLYRHRPHARITVVEIAPEVVDAARTFFHLPDDPQRLRIEIGDGHEYLIAKSKAFDFMIVDGFDDRGRAGMLDTLPFHLNARQRLSRQGLVATNLLTRRNNVDASVARLRTAFDDRVLVIPPTEAGNTVAIAATGPRIEASIEELRGSARHLKAATGLDLLPAVSRLEKARGEAIAL